MSSSPTLGRESTASRSSSTKLRERDELVMGSKRRGKLDDPFFAWLDDDEAM